jgi:hypothetical protein
VALKRNETRASSARRPPGAHITYTLERLDVEGSQAKTRSKSSSSFAKQRACSNRGSREWRRWGPLAEFEGADHWVESPVKNGVALIGDAAASSDPSWVCGLSLTLLDVEHRGCAVRQCPVKLQDQISSPNEEQAVRAVIAWFLEGWNTHEADKMFSAYAEDISIRAESPCTNRQTEAAWAGRTQRPGAEETILPAGEATRTQHTPAFDVMTGTFVALRRRSLWRMPTCPYRHI